MNFSINTEPCEFDAGRLHLFWSVIVWKKVTFLFHRRCIFGFRIWVESQKYFPYGGFFLYSLPISLNYELRFFRIKISKLLLFPIKITYVDHYITLSWFLWYIYFLIKLLSLSCLYPNVLNVLGISTFASFEGYY